MTPLGLGIKGDDMKIIRFIPVITKRRNRRMQCGAYAHFLQLCSNICELIIIIHQTSLGMAVVKSFITIEL